MSRSLNKVMLIGNIGAEPEVKTTGAGTKFAKVSLATNRTWNDRSGQKQEKTEWHRLTFWDRLAELVEQYVHKGDRIYVEDQQGQQRYWTDIIVQEMVLLGAGGAGQGGGFEGGYEGGRARQPQQQRRSPAPQQGSTASPFDSGDDDLPF
jgi:single-strand DNA-binding protein